MFNISNVSKGNLFVGSLITSIIGASALLFADFAWWNSYNYYLGTGYSGYLDVSSENLLVAPFLIVSAVLLLYVSYVSYLGLTGKTLSQELIYASYACLGSIATQVFVAVVFVIIVILEDIYWGFDLGFYAGILGAGLSALFIYLASKE
ncbi:MAG: hypothetical protein ACTSPV_15265 [Candidatus Hodarchaeales archaeon]